MDKNKKRKFSGKYKAYALVIENSSEIAGIYLSRKAAEAEIEHLRMFDVDGKISVENCALMFLNS